MKDIVKNMWEGILEGTGPAIKPIKNEKSFEVKMNEEDTKIVKEYTKANDEKHSDWSANAEALEAEEIEEEEIDGLARYETAEEIELAEKAIKLLRKQKPMLMYKAEAAIRRFNSGAITIDATRSENKGSVLRMIDMIDAYVKKHNG